MAIDIDDEKRAAATAAAALVEEGMVVGLGTGSTVAHLIPALAARLLSISCVATSPATEALALAHGLRVEPFSGIGQLSIAIDGADQVDPRGWLVKGGGGAHTREKIVAGATDRFIVIVSSDKPVAALHPPVPLELMTFGLDVVLRRWPEVRLRQAPATPDGGVLADYFGDVADPDNLSARLAATPGIVAHGLFPPSMTSVVLVGRNGRVESVTPAG
ncbi:MAG TPA: ribose 5-phosphate isomerase A [Acidimicrobiales bacterium]|jgi:ribose 5-phosphate isomerase A|nr:ribose 5-phosphate isomerase A [Acidimicrobiales bacterium]